MVLLLHGVLDSSDSFAAMKNSTANYFLEREYQVWLGNNRGNKYSCTHQTLSNKDNKFWDFSFQEMAALDLPLFIETVKQKSGVDKMDIVTHSQGGTQVFAALSENPKWQDDIGKIIKRINEFVRSQPVTTHFSDCILCQQICFKLWQIL